MYPFSEIATYSTQILSNSCVDNRISVWRCYTTHILAITTFIQPFSYNVCHQISRRCFGLGKSWFAGRMNFLPHCWWWMVRSRRFSWEHLAVCSKHRYKWKAWVPGTDWKETHGRAAFSAIVFCFSFRSKPFSWHERTGPAWSISTAWRPMSEAQPGGLAVLQTHEVWNKFFMSSEWLPLSMIIHI